MKAVLGFFGFLVLIGVVYALAFLQIIPAQKMADQSPAMMKVMQAMHLAKPKPKLTAKAGAALAVDPAKQAMDAEQAKIDADRAQLEKDRQAFAAQQAAPAADAATVASATPAVDPKQKRLDIYATMSPDDIANIFAKQPDKIVLSDLMALDEKKAGQILAALPADRAAKLTQLMNALPSSNPRSRHSVKRRSASSEGISVTSRILLRLLPPDAKLTRDLRTPQHLGQKLAAGGVGRPFDGRRRDPHRDDSVRAARNRIARRLGRQPHGDPCLGRLGLLHPSPDAASATHHRQQQQGRRQIVDEVRRHRRHERLPRLRHPREHHSEHRDGQAFPPPRPDGSNPKINPGSHDRGPNAETNFDCVHQARPGTRISSTNGAATEASNTSIDRHEPAGGRNDLRDDGVRWVRPQVIYRCA